MLIDNVLDERHYKPIELNKENVPKMLDPHDIIFFFKTEI
jgi:hypothetical protein